MGYLSTFQEKLYLIPIHIGSGQVPTMICIGSCNLLKNVPFPFSVLLNDGKCLRSLTSLASLSLSLAALSRLSRGVLDKHIQENGSISCN